MTPQPEDLLDSSPPPPSLAAREAAWTAAVREFRHQSARTNIWSVLRLRAWPIAAAAAIIVLGVIVFRPAPVPPVDLATASAPSYQDLAQLYRQGNALFDGQLQAVSVTRDRVAWHISPNLSASESLALPAADIVTLAIKEVEGPDTYIAAVMGITIPMTLQGRTHMIEFLPDADGNIIAFGDGIYWCSSEKDSPIYTSNTLANR